MKDAGVPIMDDGLWKTDQVRRYLNCSPEMVRKLIHTQQLRAKKLGGGVSVRAGGRPGLSQESAGGRGTGGPAPTAVGF